MEERATKVIVVSNRQGLHARPADMLVKAASGYNAVVELVATSGSRRGDTRSILSLMGLALEHGEEVAIEATGPDCEAATKAIAELFESKFGEE